MVTITDMKAVLRDLHQAIGGVRSVPEMRRKIETAMLPCVFIRTAGGAWKHDTTMELGCTRNFIVECLVEPLPQNILSVNEAKIDELIQRFAETYYANERLAHGCWIEIDAITDGGIEVLDFGTQYIGFVFNLSVILR